METEVTSSVDIATNSDIILVVGPEKTELHVNSCVLRNASKVFNAMFGPHFKEGQDVHASSPKEIPMPEDNADALAIVCKILHLRNDSVPDSLTPSEALQIAIVADKFDCAMRLAVHMAKWLDSGSTQDILELGRLLVASYILNDVRAFGQLSFAMISRSTDSYIPLAREFKDLIPENTFWLLEERRTFLRFQLEQLILRGWHTHCGNIRECDFPSRCAYAYLQLLHSANLWPMATVKMSISEAIDALEKIGNPTVSLDGIQCGALSLHRTPDYQRQRQAALEHFKSSIGLCLDCVLQRPHLTACAINH